MARSLGIAACCAFLACLVLPAIATGEKSTMAGWEAAAVSASLLPTAKLAELVLACAAIGNIVFLIAPWFVLKGRARRLARAFAVIVLAAFALAVASAFALGDEAFQHLRAGYYVWIAAYLLLLGAAARSLVRED